MKTLYFVKIVHVVLVSMLVNAYVNGLDNQTHILCTKVSRWEDAMNACLFEGGRPLTYDDMEMANLSGRINYTLWTAEYTAISSQRRNTSAGLDLLRETMCASQTIHLDKRNSRSFIDRVTDIKYKNCTEQKAYICDNGEDSSIENLKYVYLNETTWMNAKMSCIYKHRRLSAFIQTEFGSYIPVFVSPPMEPTKLDVWIGLVASLDLHTVRKEGGVEKANIVKYGTYSNSGGFRLIDRKLPDGLTALCGFESLQSVRPSLFTDCVKDKDEKGYPLDDSCLDNGEMTPKAPKDISTSSEDGLSRTTIIATVTVAIAVIIACTVTVALLLCFCSKRHKRKEINSDTVQFTNDSPSRATDFRSKITNNAARARDHSATEVEANYEVVSENIQPLYVNERKEDHHEALAPVNQESVYINKIPEANYEVIPDNTVPVYVNETEDGRYEALVLVNQEAVYVNKTPEGYYEKLVQNNTKYV